MAEPIRVKFPKSNFIHDFALLSDGRVTRTTVGVGKTVFVRTPKLQSREDLIRFLVGDQGYQLVSIEQEVQ